MSEVITRTVITIGQLDLQETTNVISRGLQRGDIIRLKAAKPASARPYGYAEVVAVVSDHKITIRRFN